MRKQVLIKEKVMEKITADEAARLVEDGDAILISGSGGGHSCRKLCSPPSNGASRRKASHEDLHR
jgi:hypothetical protein